MLAAHADQKKNAASCRARAGSVSVGSPRVGEVAGFSDLFCTRKEGPLARLTAVDVPFGTLVARKVVRLQE